MSATDKVNDKSKDLNNVEAKGAYDVALARAEGNHKVALEKCNAMSGDAQSKELASISSDHTRAGTLVAQCRIGTLGAEPRSGGLAPHAAN